MELHIREIWKSYDGGKNFAVKGIREILTPGVYGLLGPNGAGKSTLMNLLTQNIRPDKGEILWNGKNVGKMGNRYRSLLGYMPQQQNLYEDFSGDEFLFYIAALKGMNKQLAKKRIGELISVVNLQEARFKKLKTYSGGMRQRILIVQALLNNPDLLILDEPTAGLDPEERIRLRNFISEIADARIVLFATHVISDISFIADHIFLLRKGEIIKKGQPRELLRSLNGKVFEGTVNERQLQLLKEKKLLIADLRYGEAGIRVRVICDEALPEEYLWEGAVPELEDVYLYYQSSIAKAEPWNSCREQ